MSNEPFDLPQPSAPYLDEPRPPANAPKLVEEVETALKYHGDASFTETEGKIDDILAAIKRLEQAKDGVNLGKEDSRAFIDNLRKEYTRLCGHAIFATPEWADRGRFVSNTLRHRSERCHNSYAKHIAHVHHTLSHDDLNAFIEENGESRKRLCHMYGRCRKQYPDHESNCVPQLLSTIQSLIDLMDKNAGIVSLLAACRQRCNNGADPCSRSDCREPSPRDACGSSERYSHSDGGHYYRYHGCTPCDDQGCTPARDACGSEDPPRNACGSSERYGHSDSGRYSRYHGCTPCDYKGCTPARDALSECGHDCRGTDNRGDRRYGRCGPFKGGGSADSRNLYAEPANEHTHRPCRKHRADRCCCCHGPDTETR